jgi:ribose 5-phosphate isomerase B
MRAHLGHAELPQSDHVANVVDLMRGDGMPFPMPREQDNRLVAEAPLTEPDVTEVRGVVPVPPKRPRFEPLDMIESSAPDDADLAHDLLLKWRQKRHWLSYLPHQKLSIYHLSKHTNNVIIINIISLLFMLYIASDHRGFQLKKQLHTYIKTQLQKKIVDLGPKKYDKEDDFTKFSILLSKKVVAKKENLGILICGTAHGVCMVANKIKGGRAIVGYSIEAAEKGRQHEDANMLCLAGDYLSNEHAKAIVKKFLSTKFDGLERRLRRNQIIADLEK